MTRPMVSDHNIQTGQVTFREMTDEELAQYELDKIAAVARQEALAAKEVQRQAVLERLGITADEAKLLLS
jgi:hypothetical protein